MKVGLSLSPDVVDPSSLAPVAIAIDVLRATTVMTTALAAGADEVIVCVAVEQARQCAARLDSRPLLGGERACHRIEGFDLGNSPAEYTAAAVAGRSLLLTTTNGTRAIAAVAAADEILAASFLNLAAIVQHVSRFDSIHLVCAGTEGQISGEDVLLAGAIIANLSRLLEVREQNDACRLATRYWRSVSGDAETPAALQRRVADEIATTLGGRNLLAAGYGDDLGLCARINTTHLVPRCVSRAPLRFSAVPQPILSGRG